jgi:hypothetical protein
MADPLEPESVEAAQPAAPQQPKKPAMPPSRIAFLVFVLAAVVVIVLELRARWQFTASYQAVQEELAKGEEDGRTLYRKDLDKFLRGSPVREPQQGAETLTWQGVLRSYRMKISYGLGEFVLGIEQVP